MHAPLLLLAPLASALGPHDGVHSHAQEPKAWTRPTPSTTPVFVGSGEHRYRWESDWLQLPEGREWLGATHGGIAVDAAGRVYLSAEEGAAVLVFAADGAFLDSFGEDWGAGTHGLSIASETVVAPDGSTSRREVLYAAHLGRHACVKATLDGEVLTWFPIPPQATGLYEQEDQFRPTSVTAAPDGSVFVADGYGLYWVHRYDADGTYRASFGGRGPERHQLGTPHGLWMDVEGERPTLVVADRGKGRLARFSLDGEFIEESEPGLLRRPCRLQATGEVAVVADLEGRITLIDDEWNLIQHLGDNPDEAQRANFGVAPDAWREGHFTAPHCARIAPDGSIYVMDWNVAGRITRLVPAPL